MAAGIDTVSDARAIADVLVPSAAGDNRFWTDSAAALLAACQSTGGFLQQRPKSPYAPGTATSGDEVDGLIVGHRLMAAGEYELALKAYYRGAAEHGATVDVLSAIGSAGLASARRIGAGATILGNIEVGEGSKVAAGSVVLTPVPPHTTAAGVPAKIVGTGRSDTPAFEMKQELE